MKVLGISAFYHDSAACLLVDGKLCAAAQEERFTRVKHDENFPSNAVAYCLAAGEVGSEGPDAIVFYDKPILTFHRILETYFAIAPKGLRSFLMSMPIWMKEKLWIPPRIQKALKRLGYGSPDQIHFSEHHESHAASAFYPSPFEQAAVLTMDGVGEWATTSLGVGEGNRLTMLSDIRFPHSIGLLYSAFTYFTGFRVNSGEYKLMGLAPYGEPKFVERIRSHLIDIKDDGSFQLNMDYFGYLSDLVMTNKKFAELFDGPARSPESAITRREMDIARSIQVVTEQIVIRLARHAKKKTGMKNLCLAGGVALNCVANGKLLQEKIFDDIWIQPASGDAGGALGCALAYWHNGLEKPRQSDGKTDRMQGAYLGPQFNTAEIRDFLNARGYAYTELSESEWANRIAQLLADQNVIGMCRGRMEFGPRALGNRSILGDARSEKMQSIMNLKIKYRESFRPFAPICLEERASDFFQIDAPSRYMLLVAPLRESRCIESNDAARDEDLIKWVNQKRSDVPAITHVDYSARIQTVTKDTNAPIHALLSAFEALTGYGILINTSFNVRGEPIVCTPEDAYRCFMRTEMDYLVLDSCLLKKTDQPKWDDRENWRETFKLD